MIFSSIVLYCCDTYIITELSVVVFVLLNAITVKSHSLPALDSKQNKNLIRLSRTLVNVMGEYFANEIVKSCGKV